MDRQTDRSALSNDEYKDSKQQTYEYVVVLVSRVSDAWTKKKNAEAADLLAKLSDSSLHYLHREQQKTQSWLYQLGG